MSLEKGSGLPQFPSSHSQAKLKAMDVNDLLEFGRFRADPVRRVVLRDGQPISLPAKAFDVLLLLVQRAGETVSKDDLMKAVWPDTFVEESNLTQAVFTLRKALGEADGQSLIGTIPRQGYRFSGNVTAPTPSEVPPHPATPARVPYLPWAIAGIMTLAAAAGVLVRV